MPTNPDLAKLWAPKDMGVQEYMQMLKANQLICTRSLRDRLGFIRDGQMPFFASMAMNSDVSRRSWARFGDLRAQEADGDERAEIFTRALEAAARFHPEPQTIAVRRGLEHPRPLPVLRHSAPFVPAPHMRYPFSRAFRAAHLVEELADGNRRVRLRHQRRRVRWDGRGERRFQRRLWPELAEETGLVARAEDVGLLGTLVGHVEDILRATVGALVHS